MLDDFCEEQGFNYKFVKNSIICDRCSHAYLINTNGYQKGLDFAKSIAKCILCPKNKTNMNDCSDCNQCQLIDNDSFSDFKIIKKDGLWIKKEQMDELQVAFSLKSLNSGKKVYIIDGVEDLNISASNSILKFLEEPEAGIVAILVTTNINKVLNTIVSRCQVLNLNCNNFDTGSMLLNIGNKLYNDSVKVSDFVNDVDSINRVSRVIDFVNYLEKNKFDTLVYIDNLWKDHFVSKEDYLFGFDIMLLFYSDVLNSLFGRRILFSEFSLIISNYSFLSYEDINKRLSMIVNAKNDVYSNVNLDLLMDKFIIDMEGL